LSDESRANVSQQAADACGGEAEAMASLDLALELAHALASTHGDELVGEDANEVTAAEIINKAVSMLTTAAVGVSAFLRVACAMVDLLELHDGAVNGNTLRMPTINVMPSPALVATVRQWCRHALQQGSDVASRFGDAPSLEKFQLSVLPPSYTDLHCDLVQQLSDSLGASETTEVRPALCLLCGTVIDENLLLNPFLFPCEHAFICLHFHHDAGAGRKWQRQVHSACRYMWARQRRVLPFAGVHRSVDARHACCLPASPLCGPSWGEARPIPRPTSAPRPTASQPPP